MNGRLTIVAPSGNAVPNGAARRLTGFQVDSTLHQNMTEAAIALIQAQRQHCVFEGAARCVRL